LAGLNLMAKEKADNSAGPRFYRKELGARKRIQKPEARRKTKIKLLNQVPWKSIFDGSVKSSTKSYKIGKAREFRGMRHTCCTPQ